MRVRDIFDGRFDGVVRSDAMLIAAFALGVDRSWVIAHDDSEVDAATFEQIAALLRRRSAGEPVAYITGTAGFYGREFSVTPSVLVPRPETEHLIEDAIGAMSSVARSSVLDVGTGSGAIACTLAAELPAARIDAVDVSQEALMVARANADALGVSERITFFLGNLVDPVRERRYDCVVANLPYVPTMDIASAPDPVSFEPVLALDGGADGLDLYRRLLGGVREVLETGGVLLMEAAPPTIEGLMELAREAFPDGRTEFGIDYGGRRRYVKVTT
jgi:release factor glutamine methyltransferase